MEWPILCIVCEATLGITGCNIWIAGIDKYVYYLDVGLPFLEKEEIF